jgi:hypothetical protein
MTNDRSRNALFSGTHTGGPEYCVHMTTTTAMSIPIDSQNDQLNRR